MFHFNRVKRLLTFGEAHSERVQRSYLQRMQLCELPGLSRFSRLRMQRCLYRLPLTIWGTTPCEAIPPPEQPQLQEVEERTLSGDRRKMEWARWERECSCIVVAISSSDDRGLSRKGKEDIVIFVGELSPKKTGFDLSLFDGSSPLSPCDDGLGPLGGSPLIPTLEYPLFVLSPVPSGLLLLKRGLCKHRAPCNLTNIY